MKIGNIDYTIREEYDLSLISDEYIHILNEINEGKSFENIAKEFGQMHTNIRAKAKSAIEILQGKKISKKICQNCGKLLEDGEIGKKYCNDCNNGKIYIYGHEKEHHGELVVDATYRHKGRVYAECTCSCGKRCEVRYDYLESGKTRSCGHIAQEYFEGRDLTGEVNKYGIKALYRTEEMKRECYVWHCLCTCGKEFDVLSKDFSDRKSCGHLHAESREKGMKRAHEELAKYSVNGTSAIAITSKIQKNNTSGYKGVYWKDKEQRWYATITFKRKLYYLGRYYTVEDAAEVRRIAEEHTHKDFLRWFAEEFPLLYKKISDRVENNEDDEDIKRMREIRKRNKKYREWILEYKEETKTLAEWCKELGMDYNCIRQRINAGWSVKKAFETPVRKK